MMSKRNFHRKNIARLEQGLRGLLAARVLQHRIEKRNEAEVQRPVGLASLEAECGDEQLALCRCALEQQRIAVLRKNQRLRGLRHDTDVFGDMHVAGVSKIRRTKRSERRMPQREITECLRLVAFRFARMLNGKSEIGE